MIEGTSGAELLRFDTKHLGWGWGSMQHSPLRNSDILEHAHMVEQDFIVAATGSQCVQKAPA